MIWIIVIILITVIGLNYISEYAFKEVTLSERKDKVKMFEVIKETNGYREEEYDKLGFEKLCIKSKDEKSLIGYYLNRHKESKKLIIIIHGYTANHFRSAQYIDFFTKEGFNILLIDVRSHGDSEGIYATYGFKEEEDLQIWIEFMKNKLGNDCIIGLHGHSMGAATVVNYSNNCDETVKFIIAEAPYSSGREIIKHQFKMAKAPFFPLYPCVNLKMKKRCEFSLEDVNPINSVKESTIPIMFIHGDKDRTIPYKMSIDMYIAKKQGIKELYIVPGANHLNSYGKDVELYEEKIKYFLKRVFK